MAEILAPIIFFLFGAFLGGLIGNVVPLPFTRAGASPAPRPEAPPIQRQTVEHHHHHQVTRHHHQRRGGDGDAVGAVLGGLLLLGILSAILGGGKREDR